MTDLSNKTGLEQKGGTIYKMKLPTLNNFKPLQKKLQKNTSSLDNCKFSYFY